MGRPKLEIDEAQVEDLAAINCSYEEIAGIVGCGVSTLTSRFQQVIKGGRARFACSVKRKQYVVGMGSAAVFDEDGNEVEHERPPHPAMLMFLGKVHLGMVETSKLDVTNLDKLTDEQLAALAAGKVPK